MFAGACCCCLTHTCVCGVTGWRSFLAPPNLPRIPEEDSEPQSHRQSISHRRFFMATTALCNKLQQQAAATSACRIHSAETFVSKMTFLAVKLLLSVSLLACAGEERMFQIASSVRAAPVFQPSEQLLRGCCRRLLLCFSALKTSVTPPPLPQRACTQPATRCSLRVLRAGDTLGH